MQSERDTQKHKDRTIPFTYFIRPRLKACVSEKLNSSSGKESDLFLFSQGTTLVLKLITSVKQVLQFYRSVHFSRNYHFCSEDV